MRAITRHICSPEPEFKQKRHIGYWVRYYHQNCLLTSSVGYIVKITHSWFLFSQCRDLSYKLLPEASLMSYDVHFLISWCLFPKSFLLAKICFRWSWSMSRKASAHHHVNRLYRHLRLHILSECISFVIYKLPHVQKQDGEKGERGTHKRAALWNLWMAVEILLPFPIMHLLYCTYRA